MPGRKVHTAAGAVAGGAYAYYKARAERDFDRLVETGAGIASGALAGCIPDMLEPAVTPNHRGLAHSMVAGYAVTAVKLDNWSSYCRERAEHFRQLQLHPTVEPIRRLLYWFAEMFWRLAAGCLNGLQAGYASHLALDLLTPRSLPLVA